MSAIDELLEGSRQKDQNDYYNEEHPYALSIVGDPNETGDVTFVFPFGPSEMSVERVFRASAMPTLGGVIVEEQGYNWQQWRISGNFGLAPKVGYDTTTQGKEGSYDPSKAILGLPLGTTKLSGPKWTLRMLRNIFDRYAELKADPAYSHKVWLIWSNFKDGESFVIMPERVTLNRTTASRQTYPFSIEFKAVAPYTGIEEPTLYQTVLQGVLDSINNVIDTIRTGVQAAQAVFLEASEILGEVRYFAARVDAIIDDVTNVVQSAQDFLDGVTSTLAIGDTFVNSVQALLDEFLELLEPNDPASGGSTAGDNDGQLSDDVRQLFQKMADGLDAIGSQVTPNTEGYSERALVAAADGAGLAGTSDDALAAAEAAGPPTSVSALSRQSVASTDRGLVQAGGHTDERDFSDYRGYRVVVIQQGDNLTALAAKYIGDASKWYDIALTNNLSYPYISPAGGPGVLRPGDTIAIPTLARVGSPKVAGSGVGSTPRELYGVDMELVETYRSAPGHPRVDLKIDPRTNRDVAVVEGVDNLVQALQMRVWTEKGTYPLDRAYGLPQVVGRQNTGENVTRLKLALRGTLLRDHRVQAVSRMSLEVGDDILDFDLDVLPIGATRETTIKTALV